MIRMEVKSGCWSFKIMEMPESKSHSTIVSLNQAKSKLRIHIYVGLSNVQSPTPNPLKPP